MYYILYINFRRPPSPINAYPYYQPNDIFNLFQEWGYGVVWGCNVYIEKQSLVVQS